MAWGKSFDVGKAFEDMVEQNNPFAPTYIGIDFGMNDRTVAVKTYMNGDKLVVSKISEAEMYLNRPVIPRQLLIEHDTAVKEYQDLYGTEINSVALGVHTQLVFECLECKEILDPETTSFQKLINAAKEAGWLIKWHFGISGYDVYCDKHKDKCQC